MWNRQTGGAPKSETQTRKHTFTGRFSGAQLEEQRSRLEGEFRQAQKKMEVLGQLAGGIAHDFNNMPMGLSGSTELLEQSLPKGSHSDRYVAQIKATMEKAAAITKQLLAFSRQQVVEIAPNRFTRETRCREEDCLRSRRTCLFLAGGCCDGRE